MTWRKAIDIDREPKQSKRGDMGDVSYGCVSLTCTCSDAASEMDLYDDGDVAVCDACGRQFRLIKRIETQP